MSESMEKAIRELCSALRVSNAYLALERERHTAEGRGGVAQTIVRQMDLNERRIEAAMDAIVEATRA